MSFDQVMEWAGIAPEAQASVRAAWTQRNKPSWQPVFGSVRYDDGSVREQPLIELKDEPKTYLGLGGETFRDTQVSSVAGQLGSHFVLAGVTGPDTWRVQAGIHVASKKVSPLGNPTLASTVLVQAQDDNGEWKPQLAILVRQAHLPPNSGSFVRMDGTPYKDDRVSLEKVTISDALKGAGVFSDDGVQTALAAAAKRLGGRTQVEFKYGAVRTADGTWEERALLQLGKDEFVGLDGTHYASGQVSFNYTYPES
jgi:hypothetical protein